MVALKQKIVRGQIWKRKSDGVEIIIGKRKGDEWQSFRVGNPNINHHIKKFDLYKFWLLVQ